MTTKPNPQQSSLAIPLHGTTWQSRLPGLGNARLLLPIAMVLLIVSPPLRDVTLTALSDAYLQVTGFVAATLAVVYWFEVAYRRDVGHMLQNSARLQPLYAALLGALPGCGGAIVVVTQYSRGLITFGSLVSVLVATMGDAAFLLLAKEPTTGLLVIAISIVVGTLSGMVVDRIHGTEFLRAQGHLTATDTAADLAPPATRPRWQRAWLALIVPGFVFGIAVAFQYEPNAFFGALAPYEPVTWFGALSALFCVTMWALSAGSGTLGINNVPPDCKSPLAQTISDTNFVTTWVVVAFLSYELLVHALGIDLNALFATWIWLVPVLATVIGFIPGCGPQIVVTSLYLAGAIPLSAQLANAISNDGDALFPALALTPRAALLATLYSAVPALIIGYGWFFLFE